MNSVKDDEDIVSLSAKIAVAMENMFLGNRLT